MQNVQNTNNKIGKRVFKLITGEMVFGDCESVTTSNGNVEILIKHPYTPLNGGIAAYCMAEMASPVAAIQIHPMNIIWQCPLNEFEQVDAAYTQATTGIITSSKAKILV